MSDQTTPAATADKKTWVQPELTEIVTTDTEALLPYLPNLIS